MLRVAFVLRSTEIHPEFCGLSSPSLSSLIHTHSSPIHYLSFLFFELRDWGVTTFFCLFCFFAFLSLSLSLSPSFSFSFSLSLSISLSLFLFLSFALPLSQNLQIILIIITSYIKIEKGRSMGGLPYNLLHRFQVLFEHV